MLIALSSFFVISKGLRAQRLPVKVGKETMIGHIVSALTPIDAAGGKVFLEGECWNATSDIPWTEDNSFR
jgi:membrane-bound serine protease (ClpP class)